MLAVWSHSIFICIFLYVMRFNQMNEWSVQFSESILRSWFLLLILKAKLSFLNASVCIVLLQHMNFSMQESESPLLWSEVQWNSHPHAPIFINGKVFSLAPRLLTCLHYGNWSIFSWSETNNKSTVPLYSFFFYLKNKAERVHICSLHNVLHDKHWVLYYLLVIQLLRYL